MRNKTIIILGVIILILIIGFIFRDQIYSKLTTKVLQKCDPSLATSTGCALEVLSMSTEPEPPKGKIITEFGPLSNSYSDKYGLSLKYPDEINPPYTEKGCDFQLAHKDGIFGFIIWLFNPGCEYPFSPPNAKTLNDYKREYYAIPREGGEVRVYILNTEEIVTSTGTKGIKQDFVTTWFDTISGVEEKYNPENKSTRYVFYNPLRGLYVIRGNEKTLQIGLPDEFIQLEKKIIDTIRY